MVHIIALPCWSSLLINDRHGHEWVQTACWLVEEHQVRVSDQLAESWKPKASRRRSGLGCLWLYLRIYQIQITHYLFFSFFSLFLCGWPHFPMRCRALFCLVDAFRSPPMTTISPLFQASRAFFSDGCSSWFGDFHYFSWTKPCL